MRKSVTILLMVIFSNVFFFPSPVLGAPSPFGLEVGKETLSEVEKKYKIKIQGTNKWTKGPTYILDSSSNKNLKNSAKKIILIFSKKNNLVKIHAEIQKSEFKDLFRILKERYKLVSKNIPFVGNKEARFVDDQVEIVLRAPHLSFITTVEYIHKEFQKLYESGVQKEEAKKQKNLAEQFAPSLTQKETFLAPKKVRHSHPIVDRIPIEEAFQDGVSMIGQNPPLKSHNNLIENNLSFQEKIQYSDVKSIPHQIASEKKVFQKETNQAPYVDSRMSLLHEVVKIIIYATISIFLIYIIFFKIKKIIFSQLKEEKLDLRKIIDHFLIPYAAFIKKLCRKVYVWLVFSNRSRWYISKRGNWYNPVFKATVYPWGSGWNIARVGIHYEGYKSKNCAKKGINHIRA